MLNGWSNEKVCVRRNWHGRTQGLGGGWTNVEGNSRSSKDTCQNSRLHPQSFPLLPSSRKPVCTCIIGLSSVKNKLDMSYSKNQHEVDAPSKTRLHARPRPMISFHLSTSKPKHSRGFPALNVVRVMSQPFVSLDLRSLVNRNVEMPKLSHFHGYDQSLCRTT